MTSDALAGRGVRHRVVVVGGGFGGLHAVRRLRHAPVEITLVDRHNFHLFQPLVYQLATGGLSPGAIAVPLRHVFQRDRNVRVVLGEVTGWLFVHLYYLIGLQNRMLVLIRWTIGFLTRGRGTRLILSQQPSTDQAPADSLQEAGAR